MSSYFPNRWPLATNVFRALPLGALKPRGWLQRQLRIQADGLGGHLEEFWPDLGPDSGWLGGAGESWERGPYYMDGLVPLTYLLGDEALIARANKWINWTLESSSESGWFGPARNTDWWPLGIMLKVLPQYYELTGDARVITLLERFFAHMREELPKRPLQEWAVFRWAETALGAIWLYNLTGDPALLENLRLLYQQGFDWSANFADFPYTVKTPHEHTHQTHVVNNAMGVKTPGVAYAITRSDMHREVALSVMDVLDRFHGQVNGLFTGDELLAGKSPSQGTELCAAVEYMFSLETLAELFGDARFGDRLERIAFNALPATFSPDMWSHQYDQQVNQVLCNIARHPWTNNHDDSNIFGLEPNYGCCTANFHQGWPKFTSHLWMATPDGGLAAIAYAPCELRARVRGGAEVRVAVETEYPFEEIIRLRIETDSPVSFPLWLRIPAWAQGATVAIDGYHYSAGAGEYRILEKTWKPGAVVELHLPMALRAERRFNEAVSVLRGPLIYSLKMGEDWRRVRGEEPHADYEVYPTTPWNYGLALDLRKPEESIAVEQGTMGECPFSPEGAPLRLKAKGRRIPEWGLELNSAAPPPPSPARSDEPVEALTLIPYGCTNLRVTEFPLLSE